MTTKIVISGYYGFHNAGDEAMLLAILSSLRRDIADVEITVISGDPKLTSVRYAVNSVHRFAIFRIFLALMKCDLLISGGGSLLQDVTSIRSLLYYLSILFMGKLCGKKVMLYAQGIGPITRSWLKSLTKWILQKVDVISVRDKESQQYLQDMGIYANKIHVTADAVFMLGRTSLDDGKILLSRYNMDTDGGVIAVAVRSWHNDMFMGALVDALDNLADHGKKILLIPFQYPSDMYVTKKLQKALRHDAKVINKECSTDELLSIIGNVQMLIAMRLHALIFAAVMGIPFVALDYDPKVNGFVKLVNGSSAGDIDTITTDKILMAYSEATEHKVTLDNLSSLSCANNTLVRELLERSIEKC